MKLENVAVLGVGMTRFGVYRDRSNIDLAREAGLAALRDAGISFKDVGESFVGYIAGMPMTGIRAMKEFGLTGLPATHVENASATGLVAFRDAAWAVASGRCQIAMALGFDKMTEMSVGRGAGRGVGRDAIDSVILPAAYFSLWAMRRMHERGTRPEHFAAIAAKNWNFGAKNPWSDRQPDHEVTVEEVLASRKIAEPVTAMMSCPVDDGAACAILTTKEIARRLQPGRPLVAPIASALQSETYARGHTFMGPVVGPPSMTRDTAREAYEAAGLGPEDVSLTLVHDAFATEELEYYELLGFCREGEAEKLVEEKQTHLGGRFPFNTDGGLIARGHPGGPTGLAQIFELTRQLRGEAGPRQVANARIGLAHLVGGGSVCTISILQKE
jgi:acetyl-CoA acetyltransferase